MLSGDNGLYATGDLPDLIVTLGPATPLVSLLSLSHLATHLLIPLPVVRIRRGH